MKKLGLYSVLVSALLFTTGCSEKNADVDNVVGANDAASVEAPIQDGTLLEKASNGNYYMINGQRVLIEHVYFGFDKYNLTADNKSKAVSNASKLSAVSSDTTVKVLGNTDEWGSDEYNYALGLKRANAVKDVLVANGVTTNISLVSLGESNPVCTEKTKDCWAQNRRVEHELEK
ncbi:OmpA family protein [Aliarcobacter butzleri]|jgi:peptidoglycan-associated lipoprotein|uniref:OmpA/MotB n=7 Tax=root TaxID=1 RepID=A8EV64_ALIB4|nr:OmpA family protein [Aliarcobacter butzleri]MCP3649777.1 OmpA family protein [Arcobacter sp. DNRA7]ABV67837.1 OmpA/MotB precursor [Aliarcobacter butzleri RM4018]AGR77871.1 Tol-Pal system peptidoglycan-associated lipoprotein [Aliarcobacter butzleri 7h1h]EFU68794.1 lipoprotein [Aliarcobacter butzleri JV22]KLD96787.1 membrane protein [Aliarcobacter butzleri L349]